VSRWRASADRHRREALLPRKGLDPAADPLAGMIGVDDAEPLAPGESIEDVVYR